jgi:hypothetical protein
MLELLEAHFIQLYTEYHILTGAPGPAWPRTNPCTSKHKWLALLARVEYMDSIVKSFYNEDNESLLWEFEKLSRDVKNYL